MTNPQDIADAYRKVAEVNHYLVTVTSGHTWNELASAEQILIMADNATDNHQDATLQLALGSDRG